MKILALDPATKTGWAHSHGKSGTWDFTAKRDESLAMRLVKLRCSLDKIFESDGFGIVVFEAVRHGGPANGAAIVQAELQGVLKMWCEEHHIPYKGYSPGSIKKFATGNGNAKKPAMVDAAERKWKRIFQDSDDNEVDALWILEFAKQDLGI